MSVSKARNPPTPTPKPNPPPVKPTPETGQNTAPPKAPPSTGQQPVDTFTPSPTPGPSPKPPPPGSDSLSGGDILDGLQTGLDVIGFIPGVGEIADIANAGVSAARGNYLEAGLSLLSLVPVVGDTVGKGAKYALKAADAGAAKKALDGLKSADMEGFFKKLSQNPTVAKYLEPLRKALDTVVGKLTEIVEKAVPRPVMAGAEPPRTQPKETGGKPWTGGKGGYKQGDHVFNSGLKKLGLEAPKNHPFLAKALDTFNAGLKRLESTGAFDIVGDKTVLSKGSKKKFNPNETDANAGQFGQALQGLRDQWSHLSNVVDNPKSSATQRAAAVRDTVAALETLRKSCFDSETVTALSKAGALDPALKRKIESTQQQLGTLFDGLIGQVEKLKPSPFELGKDLAG
ncbi:hypothetical protein [Myxococcus landrumensis]|uniref:Uncharacterized protein n=1 Tax=Myxococcus landrumensis TaxID=2813577 RepID=A0ABX7N8M4_9BACT|nr:hypothetical protein [Myxococcus landrumus]QSQ15116.1 hypothetical protein JY572_03240 [Myxococcus landrumus]